MAHYLLGGFALAAFVIFAAVPSRPDSGKTWLELAFLLSAFAALLACRWPAFLWPHQMNPDESGMIACAMKARLDIVPWRGFDAGTSGPLNCDILLFPALFGAEIGYFSARLIGLCLMAGAIGGLYYTVKWVYGASIARLSVVGPVLFLALTKFGDFVGYSSEHLSIFLTTIALAAASYLARGTGSRTSRLIACATAGLFLGSVGFAKLQGLPVALSVLIAVVAGIFITPARSSRDRRIEIVMLLATLLAVPFAMLIILCVTGSLADAIISYYKMASVYIGLMPPVGISFFFCSGREYPVFLICSLIAMLAGGIALFTRAQFTRNFIWASLCSLLLLIASIFAIYKAHRPFPHYLLFTVIPVGFCVANALVLLQQASLPVDRKVLFRGLFIAVFLIPIGFTALKFSQEVGPDLSGYMGKELEALGRYVTPGERMVLWGWNPEYYVRTKTIMSTRDSGIWDLVERHPYREYFRDRFMADLRAHPPRVIVDCVAPGAFIYVDRATHGMQTFPLFDAFVQEHYEQREEVAGVRIFVARNLR